MNKQKELLKIAGEIERCRLCKKGGVGRAVPGEGSAEAAVMFVGEAPGVQESLAGRPFISRSGRFLRQHIGEAGLDENAVFITSPVHYLPVTGTPSTAMIAHGRTHLLQQLDVIKPAIVVLLGNTACRALLGKSVQIEKDHGTVILKDGIRFFITCHPAYAVRFPEGRKKFIQDFGALKQLLRSL